MQEKCEQARDGLSLARELSCGLHYSPETESLLAGYPPETNEKINNNNNNKTTGKSLLFWDINAHPFHFLLK